MPVLLGGKGTPITEDIVLWADLDLILWPDGDQIVWSD